MVTAVTISMIPMTLATVNDSLKATMPMMTAVRGSIAPNMEVRVGPMCLIALTSVMFEMAVAGNANPKMYNQVTPSVTSRMPLVKQPQMMKRSAPNPIT